MHPKLTKPSNPNTQLAVHVATALYFRGPLGPPLVGVLSLQANKSHRKAGVLRTPKKLKNPISN
jgi:hypothetical protein